MIRLRVINTAALFGFVGRLGTIALAAAALAIPVSASAQSETVEYYGTDALGSVRVVFDANGNVLSRTDYGPFGQELTPSTGRQQAVYAGLFVDDPTGLEHAQARSYQSRTGRFASADTVYAGLFEPQRWNRYSYSHNNPITFTDQAGLNEAVIHVEVHGCQDNPFSAVCTMEAWMAWWWDSGSWTGGGGAGGGNTGYVDYAGGLDPGSGTLPPSTPPGAPPTSPPPQPPGPNPPGPPSPPPGSPLNPGRCFAKGFVRGAGGAIVAAGVTAVVGAVAAPEVVTAGLLVAAGAGTYALVRSAANHYSHGNSAGLAYDAGSALGGIFVGGATAFPVRASITGETNLPTSIADFMGMGKTIEFNRPGQSVFEALRAAFAGGPDLGGAGLGVAMTGAGAVTAMGCN